jgi:hypothetical protein
VGLGEDLGEAGDYFRVLVRYIAFFRGVGG